MGEKQLEFKDYDWKKEEELYWALKARYEKALIVDAATIIALSAIFMWLIFYGTQKKRSFYKTSLATFTIMVGVYLASEIIKQKFL